MFWRKKKSVVESPANDLLSLAARLGVERRLQVRVRYPNQAHVCKLPEVGFNGHKFHVQDISIGGCCLLDPQLILGPAIGVEIKLDMTWTTGTEKIDGRIVSRADERRHIQFLNLGEKRQELLKRFMAYGVRGLSMRCNGTSAESAPNLMAAELWSSLQGDSIIVERDMHRLAQIQVAGELFLLFKEAWPVRSGGLGTCSKIELEQLILFLTNVPKLSDPLKAILAGLEDLLFSSELGEKK